MATSSFTSVKFDQVLENIRGYKTRHPRLGDHLITSRTGYTHHGIYTGRGQVIHYSGFHDGLNSGPVIKTSLSDFVNESHMMVNIHPTRKYDARESIERAYSRLGETEYSLVSNNCEHFVNWCIQGRASSKQISEVGLVLCSPSFILKFPSASVASNLLGSAASMIAGHSTKAVASKIASVVVGGSASNIAGLTSGLVGGGLTAGLGSSATVGLVGLVAGGAAAPALASVAVGVAVGYGVKKAWDWIVD